MPLCLKRLTLITIKFFFSSRRRHTICSRDWSSDVCSSDLRLDFVTANQVPRFPPVNGTISPRLQRGSAASRSEERRVGKECRSRWLPSDTKKIPKHLFQGYLKIYNNYFNTTWMPGRTEAIS